MLTFVIVTGVTPLIIPSIATLAPPGLLLANIEPVCGGNVVVVIDVLVVAIVVVLVVADVVDVVVDTVGGIIQPLISKAPIIARTKAYDFFVSNIAT